MLVRIDQAIAADDRRETETVTHETYDPADGTATLESDLGPTGRPLRDFPEPDRPWDPRLVAGLVGFVALVAGLWVLGWRRRVEA